MGGAPSATFVPPEGYRPAGRAFAQLGTSPGNVDQVRFVDIRANGRVVLRGTTPAPGFELGVDGIAFRP